MLIVRVELYSAKTGKREELAAMAICNIGGSKEEGDYEAFIFRKGSQWRHFFSRRNRASKGETSEEDFDRFYKRTVMREGIVTGHKRLRKHVWNLVWKALAAVGHGEKNDRTVSDRGRDIQSPDGA